MPKVYKYNVIDVNKIVYTGFVWEAANFMDCTSDEIREAIRYKRPIGKYTVSRQLTEERMKSKKAKEKRKQEQEEKLDPIDYLTRHLNEYGNTILGNIPEAKVKNYMEELKTRGINARYKVLVDPVDRRQRYVIKND